MKICEALEKLREVGRVGPRKRASPRSKRLRPHAVGRAGWGCGRIWPRLFGMGREVGMDEEMME